MQFKIVVHKTVVDTVIDSLKNSIASTESCCNIGFNQADKKTTVVKVTAFFKNRGLHRMVNVNDRDDKFKRKVIAVVQDEEFRRKETKIANPFVFLINLLSKSVR